MVPTITMFRTLAFGGFLSCSALGHDWASSDGSKTIRADFVGLSNNVLTLSINGKEFKSGLSFYSLADRKWAEAAREVKEKTRNAQGFIALMRTEANDCVCRMAIDPAQRKNFDCYGYHSPIYNDNGNLAKIYRGEFFLVSKGDVLNEKLGVSETHVKTLYWGGIGKTTVRPVAISNYHSTWWWNDWRVGNTSLACYRSDFECAVESLIKSRQTETEADMPRG